MRRLRPSFLFNLFCFRFFFVVVRRLFAQLPSSFSLAFPFHWSVRHLVLFCVCVGVWVLVFFPFGRSSTRFRFGSSADWPSAGDFLSSFVFCFLVCFFFGSFFLGPAAVPIPMSWSGFRPTSSLHWVLLGLTGFYWVLLGFTGFYWVLLGFTRYYLV